MLVKIHKVTGSMARPAVESSTTITPVKGAGSEAVRGGAVVGDGMIATDNTIETEVLIGDRNLSLGEICRVAHAARLAETGGL